MSTHARILLLNVNTTPHVTERIRHAAAEVALPGTVLVATQPSWGTSSVEGYYDGFVSVASSLDRLHELLNNSQDPAAGPWNAVIWAGFGDHGREAAQELLDCPVITIAEAAAHAAMLLARTFGIITTLPRSCPQIEDILRVAGLLQHCAGIWATGLEVLSAASDDAIVSACVTTGQTALRAGAEVICLGSTAMAGLSEQVSAQLGVPVVEGVSAAVSLAESLHRLRLVTSKVNAYALPRPKHRPGWPVSQSSSGL